MLATVPTPMMVSRGSGRGEVADHAVEQSPDLRFLRDFRNMPVDLPYLLGRQHAQDLAGPDRADVQILYALGLADVDVTVLLD